MFGDSTHALQLNLKFISGSHQHQYQLAQCLDMPLVTGSSSGAG